MVIKTIRSLTNGQFRNIYKPLKVQSNNINDKLKEIVWQIVNFHELRKMNIHLVSDIATNIDGLSTVSIDEGKKAVIDAFNA